MLATRPAAIAPRLASLMPGGGAGGAGGGGGGWGGNAEGGFTGVGAVSGRFLWQAVRPKVSPTERAISARRFIAASTYGLVPRICDHAGYWAPPDVANCRTAPDTTSRIDRKSTRLNSSHRR